VSDHKKHIDLSNGLTEDIMLAYLNNMLSNGDRHLIEKYLLDNPFEAEAMEGLQDFSGFVTEDISNLDKQLNERIKKGKKRAIIFWNRPLQIAAAITVLIVSSWLIFSILDTGLDQQNVVMEQTDDPDSNLDKELGKKAKPVSPIMMDSTIGHKRKTASKSIIKKIEEPKIDQESIAQNKTLTPENYLEEELTPIEETEGLIIPSTPIATSNDAIALGETPKALDDILDQEDVLDEVMFEELPMDEDLVIVEDIAAVERRALTGSISIEDSKKQGLSVQNSPINEITGRVQGISIDERRSAKRMKKSFSLSESPDQFESKLLSGTVYDEYGETLPGATVTIKGTTYGTITDIEGRYELQSQRTDDILLIAFIGYKSMELATEDSVNFDAYMESDVAALEEVVIIGYGTEKTELESYQSARPNNGFIAFRKYLKSEIRYPQAAKDNEITGKVLIAFDVTTNGELINLKVIKSLGYGCDEEAIRLIKEGPRWKPSERNGQPFVDKVKVKVRFEN